MTRINLVDPTYLTNEHLRGEYKEISRTFTHVKKAINNGKTPKDFNVPLSYVLGKGHVTFFYDKLEYIKDRYLSLFNEMKRRGYSPNEDTVCSILESYERDISSIWKNNYTPTPEEIYLNMCRLCIRSKIHNVSKELTNSLI